MARSWAQTQWLFFIVLTLTSLSAWSDRSYLRPDGLQTAPPEKVRTFLATLNTVAPPIAQQVAARRDPQCVRNKNDLFEPGLRMAFGGDRGKCIDTREVRPPTIIYECLGTGAHSAPCQPNTVVVANFLHMGQYWMAQIPIDGVERIEPIIGHIRGNFFERIGVAHFEILIVMKPNPESQILLYPQGNQNEPVVLNQMMISGDKFFPYGNSGNVLEGICGYNGIALRLVSVVDRINEQAIQRNFIPDAGYKALETYHPSLSAAQKQEFMINSLRFSAQKGYSDIYDYLDHNCVHVALDLLDHSLPSIPARGNPFQISVLRTILVGAGVIEPLREALAARHLNGNGVPTYLDIDLNNGLSWLPLYFMNLSTQSQRESYIRAYMEGLYQTTPAAANLRQSLAVELMKLSEQPSERMNVADALVIAGTSFEQHKAMLIHLKQVKDYIDKVPGHANMDLEKAQNRVIHFVPDPEEQQALRAFVQNGYNDRGGFSDVRTPRASGGKVRWSFPAQCNRP